MNDLPFNTENKNKSNDLSKSKAAIIAEVQGIPLEVAEKFLSVKGAMKETDFCKRKIKLNDPQK